MSKFEQRDNSGVLFKNDRRENDKHPNAKGTALIDGVEYYVSAWTKEGQKSRFQSLSFERKGAKPKARPKDEARQARADDDAPF